VGEVAGVVVRHPERDGMARGDGIRLGEQLGDVAHLLGELLGPLGPLGVVGKEVANITEYEPVEEGDRELAGELADNIPERD
jgi:hypothetical protein